ncbi:Ig domain-containing protein, partial [Treponema saccharophilum]|uniref:Ig-like domain-containing protein n=1 Tax=Treponema saccharophilum TaxID=165 RepID=UPI00386F397E
GDFTYTFNDSVEDTNYTVIADLKSAVTNYKTKLEKVYGTKWVYDISSGGSSEAGESGGTTTGENVAVTGVSLSKTALALKAGNSETITATIEPANATTQDVTWSSDNTGVAKVSDGKITAVEEGEATITVTTKDGSFTATCTVTVEAIHATDLTLSKTELELTAGKIETITATLEPADATDSVTWSSSNKAIATVDKNGKITAVAEGTVTITAKAGTIEKTCEVTVTAAPADDLSGLVALADGFYNLSTAKITVDNTEYAAVFSKNSAGNAVTQSGITITCAIDSKGANLSTKAVGKVYFKLDATKTVTFADSNSKGAAVYAVSEDGTVSETAQTNNSTTANSYSYTLSAGTYAIKGTTSSSAKIASITVE